MTADTDTPPPTPPASESLKGVYNTNENPLCCTICAVVLGLVPNTLNPCCGKLACVNCSEAGKSYDKKAGRCHLCHATSIDSVGLLKKQAKKGHPWAQAQLGSEYTKGKVLTQSHYEAARWYRKAAAKGHPRAMLNLSIAYSEGEGCSRDLAEARAWTQEAAIFDHFKDPAISRLALVGIEYYRSGKHDEAKSTLSAILEMDLSLIHIPSPRDAHESRMPSSA